MSLHVSVEFEEIRSVSVHECTLVHAGVVKGKTKHTHTHTARPSAEQKEYILLH